MPPDRGHSEFPEEGWGPNASAGLRLMRPLQIALLVSAFIGYPMAALLPTLFGMETRLVSLPYRGLVVLLALAVLALAHGTRRKARRDRTAVLWFVLAWSAMLLRFLFDVGLRGVQPSVAFPAGPEFLLFVLGAGLIPSLPLFLPLDQRQLKLAHRWMTVLTILVALTYAWKFQEVSNDVAQPLARAQTEALNAITYGTLGATVVVLALLYPYRGMPPLKRLLYMAAAMVVGGGVMINSGSRGPWVALMAVVVVTMIGRARSRRTAIVIGLAAIILLAIGMSVLPHLASRLSEDYFIASRIDGLDSDKSTIERIYILQSSWNVFLANPLLGGAIAEPVTHSYPHNIILEGLMVGGIGLGFLVLVIVAYCLSRAYAMISASDHGSFLGGIAVFQIVMAMISGSLYTGPEFWFVFALLVAHAGPQR